MKGEGTLNYAPHHKIKAYTWAGNANTPTMAKAQVKLWIYRKTPACKLLVCDQCYITPGTSGLLLTLSWSVFSAETNDADIYTLSILENARTSVTSRSNTLTCKKLAQLPRDRRSSQSTVCGLSSVPDIVCTDQRDHCMRTGFTQRILPCSLYVMQAGMTHRQSFLASHWFFLFF